MFIEKIVSLWCQLYYLVKNKMLNQPRPLLSKFKLQVTETGSTFWSKTSGFAPKVFQWGMKEGELLISWFKFSLYYKYIFFCWEGGGGGFSSPIFRRMKVHFQKEVKSPPGTYNTLFCKEDPHRVHKHKHSYTL